MVVEPFGGKWISTAPHAGKVAQGYTHHGRRWRALLTWLPGIRLAPPWPIWHPVHVAPSE